MKPDCNNMCLLFPRLLYFCLGRRSPNISETIGHTILEDYVSPEAGFVQVKLGYKSQLPGDQLNQSAKHLLSVPQKVPVEKSPLNQALMELS